MSTISSINSISNTANGNKNAISKKNDLYVNKSSTLLADWKGEIIGVYSDTNRRVGSHVKNTLGGYSSLNSKLGDLSKSFIKAEDEEDKKKALVSI